MFSEVKYIYFSKNCEGAICYCVTSYSLSDYRQVGSALVYTTHKLTINTNTH